MIPFKRIISWSLRAEEISKMVAEIETERGTPSIVDGTAVMKALWLKAEPNPLQTASRM